MPSFRVNKTKNYTVMSNYHLKDRRLSLKAKGLLSLMLSLPENWDYSVKGLVSICKEGESSVESGLKELKKCGYLVLDKIPPSQTKSGRFEYIYNIYECPEEKQGGNFLGVEKQGVEILPVEILGLENHPLNKDTKELNTKELNTKEKNINQSIYSIDDIREKIGYMYLMNDYNGDRMIDEIVLLIREILNSNDDQIKIAGSIRNGQDVKDIFSKLNIFHVQYVLKCLKENTVDIKNIKAYMLACLYNAPMTIDAYYNNEVKKDLGY